jgi:hypothetical protein
MDRQMSIHFFRESYLLLIEKGFIRYGRYYPSLQAKRFNIT